MTRLFVDTSAWIALHNRRDQRHGTAADAFASLKGRRVRLITTDYVVDETITHLRLTSGHAAAVHFVDVIRDHPLIDWLEIDRNSWAAAWSLFCRYDDKSLSFTDCTSFAIMEALDLAEAFTFDAHFVQAGRQLWPGPG